VKNADDPGVLANMPEDVDKLVPESSRSPVLFNDFLTVALNNALIDFGVA
jgi:hypothetical protein